MTEEREKIREVARVTGLLVVAIPAVEMVKIHYIKLERAKIKALEREKGKFNRWMAITDRQISIGGSMNWQLRT